MDEIETTTLRKEGKTADKHRATTSSKSKPSDGTIKKNKKTAGDKKEDGMGKTKAGKNKMKKNKKKKKGKKPKAEDTSDADTDQSDDESDDDDSSDSSDPDPDADRTKKKGKALKARKKAKQKKKAKDKKKAKKTQAEDSDTDDSLSVGSSAADDDEEKETSDEDDSSGSPNLDDRIRVLESYMNSLSVRNASNPYYSGSYGLDAVPKPNDIVPPPPGRPSSFFPPLGGPAGGARGLPPSLRRLGRGRGRRGAEDEVTEKKTTRPEFKRVDWVWDTDRYTYKLQDTAKTSTDSQYEGYVFHVRRTFDHEGKYRRTFVDIKSKLLRECLQDVIKNINGVSLVDETPKLDPNMLFLYVEDLRAHLGALKELEPAGETRKERKKNQKRLDDKRKHLKVLIKYVDKDFADIKNTLEPMLASGLVTFDLLWALWKPGTLVYSPTYGSPDTPRVFKVDVAERHCSMMKGDFYFVEAKYFEYDGKRFGYGNVGEEISEFKGARKITSLSCYPLSYHKAEAELREKLIERGKKFVTLAGVHFRAYSGMAFMKRKKGVIKFNISNSRIMVDPAIFRRINPNYYVSHVKPKNHDILSLSGDSSDSEDCCGCDDSEEDSEEEDGEKKKPKYVIKMFKDNEGNDQWIRIREDQLDESENEEELDELQENKVVDGEVVKASEVKDEVKAEVKEGEPKVEESRKDETPKEEGKPEEPTETTEDKATGDSKDTTDKSETQIGTKTPSTSATEDDKEANKIELPLLTDEEYLISSPVVLGFSFAEKQWLEFDVSSIQDIKWNEAAWDSLVLEPSTKDLIKALVESRKFSAATTIDDVIQGKGKGLVTVLHGPPGTGKTLTAEGISELLKCPLYMASAGELGTDSRFLEHELQKILDICHTWGAILLLDEADVFLEKRNMQDIHRNALVSIFLRQLEYFQGILFLTTNRVETFDEAFQSRIHIALRYDKLDAKAKRAIFKLFLERIQTHGKLEIKSFSEDDIAALAKHDLNGREIKNVMGSAQDLAVNKGEALSLRHVRLVLDVHAKFGRDLKGGSGFEDAMRSYF